MYFLHGIASALIDTISYNLYVTSIKFNSAPRQSILYCNCNFNYESIGVCFNTFFPFSIWFYFKMFCVRTSSLCCPQSEPFQHKRAIIKYSHVVNNSDGNVAATMLMAAVVAVTTSRQRRQRSIPIPCPSHTNNCKRVRW